MVERKWLLIVTAILIAPVSLALAVVGADVRLDLTVWLAGFAGGMLSTKVLFLAALTADHKRRGGTDGGQ